MDVEKQLLPMLKSGDENAFAVLYDAYAAMLFGVIVRIVNDKKEAENLLQDCFIKIWQNVDFYDAEKGRLATWLLRIARNAAIDFTRSKYYSQKRKNQNLENIVFQETVYGTAQTPVDSMGLRQLVGKLTPSCRKVIELMYFNGYTQQEIADEFDIPIGTVKSRTRMALKELRHFYDLI